MKEAGVNYNRNRNLTTSLGAAAIVLTLAGAAENAQADGGSGQLGDKLGRPSIETINPSDKPSKPGETILVASCKGDFNLLHKQFKVTVLKNSNDTPDVRYGPRPNIYDSTDKVIIFEQKLSDYDLKYMQEGGTPKVVYGIIKIDGARKIAKGIDTHGQKKDLTQQYRNAKPNTSFIGQDLLTGFFGDEAKDGYRTKEIPCSPAREQAQIFDVNNLYNISPFKELAANKPGS